MTTKQTYSLWDITGEVADYEDGSLNEDQEFALFEKLVDSGIIYHLQGSYQRQAQNLGFAL